MARPSVAPLAEEAHLQLGGDEYSVAAPDGEATGWGLLKLLNSLLAPVQEIADVVRDDDDRPGWSKALDPDTCPPRWLRWCGQFYGVRVTPGDWRDPLWVAQARDEVKSAAGIRRGTVGGMTAAVQRTLTGTKHVSIVERIEGNAYRLAVRTNASETPDAAATQRAALSQKPAGLKLYYFCTDVPLIAEMTRNVSGITHNIDGSLRLSDVT